MRYIFEEVFFFFCSKNKKEEANIDIMMDDIGAEPAGE